MILNQVNLNDGLIHLSSDDSDSESEVDSPMPDAPPNTPEDPTMQQSVDSPAPLGQMVEDMIISAGSPVPSVPPGFEHVTPSLGDNDPVPLETSAHNNNLASVVSNQNEAPALPSQKSPHPPPSTTKSATLKEIQLDQTLEAIPAGALFQTPSQLMDNKRRKLLDGKVLCDAEIGKFLFECLKIISRGPKTLIFSSHFLLL